MERAQLDASLELWRNFDPIPERFKSIAPEIRERGTVHLAYIAKPHFEAYFAHGTKVDSAGGGYEVVNALHRHPNRSLLHSRFVSKSARLRAVVIEDGMRLLGTAKQSRCGQTLPIVSADGNTPRMGTLRLDDDEKIQGVLHKMAALEMHLCRAAKRCTRTAGTCRRSLSDGKYSTEAEEVLRFFGHEESFGRSRNTA